VSPGSITSSAKTTAAKLSALARKAELGPAAAMKAPPAAGPIARAVLNWRLFIVMADGRSSTGTSSGMNDCHVGMVKALINPPSAATATMIEGLRWPDA